MRRAYWIAVSGLLLVAGCGPDDGKMYPVSSAGQGYVRLREEQVEPARPAVKVVEVPVERKGPTTREVEMQRKIDDLEAKSREMEEQTKRMREEIERLRREKAGT
jgi:hypothetical protein